MEPESASPQDPSPKRQTPAEAATAMRDSAVDAANAAATAVRDGMRGRVASHGDTQASNGNVANIITVARILLAPVFMWLLLQDSGQLGVLRWVAAGLFILAIVTDSLDGNIARRQNLVTDVGIILDPIADKVLIGGALVALSILGELWWWVTIVILVREFGITIFRFIALRDRVIPASWGGKVKTIVQAVAVSMFLVPLWLFLGPWVHVLNWIVMGIAVALTVFTGAEYLVNAWRYTRSTPAQ
jgi:CDP-diacylglycerol--glycerol-3-phosphate 3-phosphatidyltransferase